MIGYHYSVNSSCRSARAGCVDSKRALADAMTTAHLLMQMQQDMAFRFARVLDGAPVDHALLCDVQRAQRLQVERCLQQRAGRAAVTQAA